MMPTYQRPLVNPSSPQQQDQQVYFKHHFENPAQYVPVPPQTYGPVPAQNYGPAPVPAQTYGPAPVPAQTYGPASSTFAPPTPSYQGDIIVGQHYGNTPPVQPPKQSNQFTGYQFPPQQSNFGPPSTLKPNTNTIDNSVVTFTTQRPQNNRPLRFTAASTVTNAEYLPPPNVLPLEGENSQFKPIPIPNLSPSPIPPLFDARPFHDDPYRNDKTGTIKLVPLEPVAQLSSNVNVQVKPERNSQRFENVNESPAVEVISSNLVAEFTLPAKYAPSESTTTRPATKQGGFRLNLDLGNNLDANATLTTAIVVESHESATDTVGAGSEHNYEENVNQAVEAPRDRIVGIDDDLIDTKESGRIVTPRAETTISFEEATTDAGRYSVKFEPSLQTAADLALAKPSKKPESAKKSRPTPLEMLDSPILHATPFVAKSKITTTTPAFKPLDDYTKHLSTLWTSQPSISTSTEPTPTPTTVYATRSTTRASSSIDPTIQSTASTVSVLSKLSSGVYSGITPPKELPSSVKPSTSTKKPKQIQIVIPYTTFNKPLPFKVPDEQEQITYRPIRGHYVTHPSRQNKTDVKSTLENLQKIENLIRIEKNERQEKKNQKPEETFNGHGYPNDQEYPDHAQESKIVESKVTAAPAITTKYFTKILANNIRDLLKREKTPKPPRIDLIKLQKNIDGWTEQSFSGKASTNSLMGHTKAIPTSFISTMMIKSTTVMQPTTTLSPKTTFDPDLMEEARRQYDNILYKKNDEDSLYVKRHDRFLNRDNELVLINNNLTYNSFHEGGVKVFAPKTTLAPKELWKRLHVTISPLTNEKIYVVTPQPHTDGANDQKTSTFRPRFSVRPTVAGRN